MPVFREVGWGGAGVPRGLKESLEMRGRWTAAAKEGGGGGESKKSEENEREREGEGG